MARQSPFPGRAPVGKACRREYCRVSSEARLPPANVNVIVGTTPTDALASVVAKVRGNPDEARLLEAFMLGSLSDFDQADGPAITDALLQANGFFSRDGGMTTEQIWIPAMPPLNPATPATTPTPQNSGIFSSQPVAAVSNAKAQNIVEATAKITRGCHGIEHYQAANSSHWAPRLQDSARFIPSRRSAKHRRHSASLDSPHRRKLQGTTKQCSARSRVCFSPLIPSS